MVAQKLTNYDKPLTKDLLKHPLSQEDGKQLLRHLARFSFSQAAAATATSDKVMRDAGRIVRVRGMVGGALCASGESMVIDVLKNGVSILTAAITLDSSSTADAFVNAVITGGSAAFSRGDLIRISLTYTAGGGPTPTTNHLVEVDIEYNN